MLMLCLCFPSHDMYSTYSSSLPFVTRIQGCIPDPLPRYGACRTFCLVNKRGVSLRGNDALYLQQAVCVRFTKNYKAEPRRIQSTPQHQRHNTHSSTAIGSNSRHLVTKLAPRVGASSRAFSVDAGLVEFGYVWGSRLTNNDVGDGIRPDKQTYY